jgi:lysophospholipid acyltransferase (LPLAT)-like uncharacterized protein
LLFQQLAGLLAGFLFKIYSSTFRYHLHFEDEADRRILFRDLETKEPSLTNLIYACYHQDDLSCLPFFSDKKICIMISQSKDGQILSSAVEYMGYQTVRGSSHRGAVAGLLAGIKKVREGHKMTIAVDGPRGPIYKVKEGITALSQKSGRPIAPVVAHPRNKYIFEKSWNKASLPLPCARIDLFLGKIKDYSRDELQEKMSSLKNQPWS